MGWISDRHMKSGGSIGGRSGKHKGPLRTVKEVIRFAEGLFDYDSVIFDCGHQGRRSNGALRGRCGECGKSQTESRPAQG